MIISLHSPKAGGISFKELLHTHFGTGFMPDYKDRPISKSLGERRADVKQFHERFELEKANYKKTNVQCIHGHFLPYKYSKLISDPNTIFVTWLRDPLERLASHYHFWQRDYNEETAGALRKKMMKESWSFEKFCFSEDVKNIYSQFLWSFPIEQFDFIGITEHFDSDAIYFANNFLKLDNIKIERSNVNPSKKKSYYSDSNFIKKLREFHSKDYELYNYALNQRAIRMRNS
ncbi:MAG: sulfotransferase family 2 domain-containing protein [Halioglobus sp.]|nr:sulfotransferase family 2 domain-containing protein [Halioglobus sp.]